MISEKMTSLENNKKQVLSLNTILIATGLVMTLSMGVRHGFGFWLSPISQQYDWTREVYSLAIALQNLLWGLFGPLAGIAAARFSTRRVIMAGAVFYAAGLLWMAWIHQPIFFVIGSGVLVGAGLACTTFGVLSGIIARYAPLTKRSWAFGISSAAGSLGQFAFMPLEQILISYWGWQWAFYCLAALVIAIMWPVAWRLQEERPTEITTHAGSSQTTFTAIREAFTHKPFVLLLSGYFVCGFQLVFIGVHLPVYLKDQGILAAHVPTIALALVGLFNIFGSYQAGRLGGIWPKPYLLSGIYALRALVIALFLYLPISPLSVYVFAAAMGFLWLSTVPLTNGVIASIFGIQHLSMLSGFVFLSHQVGSFLGAWLGGYLYSRQGNYNSVWVITILLGVMAALVNLPIREVPIARSTLQGA